MSTNKSAFRAVAQFGSALDWGSRGRRFKSCQPDWQVELVLGLIVGRRRWGLLAASSALAIRTKAQEVQFDLLEADVNFLLCLPGISASWQSHPSFFEP